MDTPIALAVAVLALVGGTILGFVLAGRVWAPQVIKAAQTEAKRINAEARERQKDLILEAKDEKLRLQRGRGGGAGEADRARQPRAPAAGS
jgi:hypothetical protein